MTESRTGRRMDLDRMRAAVAELLGEPPLTVGVDDDLVGLGLDSISVIRLAGQWRRAGAEVSYAELMEHRTLAEWWALVARQDRHRGRRRAGAVGGRGRAVRAGPHAARVLGRPGRRPGARRGRGAVLLRVRRGGGPARTGWSGPCAGCSRRHGMLRARFLDDGRQQILPESPWPGLTVHDLRDAGEAAEDRAVRVRELLSQRRMAAERGEVLDVQLTLLPGGAHPGARGDRDARLRRPELPGPAPGAGGPLRRARRAAHRWATASPATLPAGSAGAPRATRPTGSTGSAGCRTCRGRRSCRSPSTRRCWTPGGTSAAAAR